MASFISSTDTGASGFLIMPFSDFTLSFISWSCMPEHSDMTQTKYGI